MVTKISKHATPWANAVARLVGSSHKTQGVPCQDWVIHRSFGNVEVIALADGASSARLSHLGAEKVTNAVADFLGENYNRCYKSKHLAQEVNELLQEILGEEASDRGCLVGDLASTLLAVATYKHTAILLHIGDGVIAGYRDTEVAVFSNPDNGKYANETQFSTNFENLSRIRVQRMDVSKVSGFLIFSDGIEASLYDASSQEVSKSVKKLFKATLESEGKTIEHDLVELMESVFSLRTVDDMSIALLARSRYKDRREYIS